VSPIVIVVGGGGGGAAEQLALVPPPDPTHVQFPEPSTVVGDPELQVPTIVPQTPFTATGSGPHPVGTGVPVAG
jgi:hypothetical protein